MHRDYKLNIFINFCKCVTESVKYYLVSINVSNFTEMTAIQTKLCKKYRMWWFYYAVSITFFPYVYCIQLKYQHIQFHVSIQTL